MKMEGARKTSTVMWTIFAAVLFLLVGFVSGYYVGELNQDSGASIIIVDDFGRAIKISEIPRRIVSVAPTPTEILFAVGAGNLVVGVDDYSDYPGEASKLPKVGSYELNTEAILALKPDLIICGDLVPLSQLSTLEQHGIPYMVLAARTVADVFKDIKLVGAITGHIDDANKLVDNLTARVDAVEAKTLAANVTKPKAYVEYYPMWTFGPGSFGDNLIKLAGATNIAANTSTEYVPVTEEFVIGGNPEIIVYTVGLNYNGTSAATISARPGWSEISAVVNGKIYSIDDNLLSRYGPRIVDGLEKLAEIVHPELF